MFAYIPELIKGLGISLSLTANALIISLVLAILFTICLTLKARILSPLVKAYIALFTGTPLLIQFFLIYYGPGQFKFIQIYFPMVWEFISNPFVCAIIALTLNSAAYSTPLLHGAVKAIPEGQWQSCAALGMSRRDSLAILLPYAFKRALSSYSNEVILVFKSTSLVYTITVMDVMGITQSIVGNNYDPMVIVNAGIIYLCVNAVLTIVMRLIENKALRFEKRS